MADSSNSAGSTASAARYGGHDRFTLELEVSLFVGNAYHWVVVHLLDAVTV